jgi:DNA-binding TFAR19-related protein (PDSD5 family)
MTMPNFLIIGAAKAGTTSLYHYLKQHPQVYLSPMKEPKFFALEGQDLDFGGPGGQEILRRSSVIDLAAYQRLFAGVSKERAVGEASTLYLYSAEAPKRIKHYIPDAKLVAILRNPVERAYSNYLYMVRKGEELSRDFREALGEEEKRIHDNWMPTWHYQRRGLYFAQLKRYYDLFDAGQIKVYLYEDLSTDAAGLLKDMFQFLDVDETFLPKMSTKYNISGVPKNKALHNFLLKPHLIKSVLRPLLSASWRKRLSMSLSNRNLVRPTLPEEVRKQLLEIYRDDILRLEVLLARDLSKWLT